MVIGVGGGVIAFLISSTYANNSACNNIGNNGIKQCAATSSNYFYLDKMPFALCSESLCTFSSDKTYAICKCLVIDKKNWQSLSLSPVNYQSAKPTYDTKTGKLNSVQSNFSLANITNFGTKLENAVCSYKDKKPWASCLGVRCTVEYKKIKGKMTKYAICHCPINYSKQYILGSSNTKDCKQNFNKVLWSAAYHNKKIKKMLDNFANSYKILYPGSPPTRISN